MVELLGEEKQLVAVRHLNYEITTAGILCSWTTRGDIEEVAGRGAMSSGRRTCTSVTSNWRQRATA